MARNFKNNPIKIEEIIILLSPFLVLLIRTILNKIGIKSICIWKLLTGHKCLGCGITQAIIYIFSVEFEKAYKTNHLVYIFLPILLYVWIKYIYMCLIKNNNSV